MKTLISTFTILLILLPLTAFSQRRPDWFTIGQYNFEINLPSRPVKIETVHSRLMDYQVDGEAFLWNALETGAVTIGVYTVLKPGERFFTDSSKAAIIAAFSQTEQKRLQEQGLAIVERAYDFSGSKGVEIRGTGKGLSVTRLFFVGFRLYSITVSADQLESFGSPIKVLNSFRLLTKAETIAALKWENDFEEVPQKRPALSVGNDLLEAGLKGNVCEVTNEVLAPPAKDREMDRESFYDRSGNLLREVNYNLGYPQEINRWGWIDGKRVSSTRVIYYWPPDGVQWTQRVTLGPITGLMGGRPDDSIFGMRHEFKYDEKGRVAEHAAYDSDGKLKWRRKYINSLTGREIQTLDETGGFLTRVVETFDKDGNVVLYKILDLSGKPFSTVRFVYEKFDQTGNWTIRRTFGVRGPSGKATGSAKPLSTVFRKIAYCDGNSL